MENKLKYYTLPHHYCSCRDEWNNLTNIGRNYREFYRKCKIEKKNAAIALNEIKILRMCCRTRLMSMSYIPMIDRSKDRYYDDTHIIRRSNTRELFFEKYPPEFPTIDV